MLRREKGLYTFPTLLAGSVETGTAFVLKGDMEPLARKKYENFEEYLSLYPEYKHVFIGDNGQGDVRAAEMMLEKYPGTFLLLAVYMHVVQPLEKTYGYRGPETLARWKSLGISFFNNYLVAAVDAYTKKLIKLSGLRKVAMKTIQDFESLRFDKATVRERKRLELNQSLAEARRLLGNELDVALSPVLAECVYPAGTLVLTPFGIGVVSCFRPLEGIYEV
ncbi:unnamed protein product, partial [Chrysoparadoxa australica]